MLFYGIEYIEKFLNFLRSSKVRRRKERVGLGRKVLVLW